MQAAVWLVAAAALCRAADDISADAADEDAPVIPEPEPFDPELGVQIMILDRVEDCSVRVADGDIIQIRHNGFYDNQQIDSDGGKPLRLQIGARNVLEGMERGMLGQCLGETRIITIPPELGFDHPEMNFKNKPVPDGSTVAYKIKVVDIAPRPGSLSFALAPVREVLEANIITITLIVIMAGIWYLFNSQAEAAEKKKRRKSAVNTIKRAQKKGKKSD
mmetsp:Transcript_14766/g.27827  ORF Transcript_14766/g.27827 Transcript_14766/m.27827 type:complete len:219 (-) Transcript_14766:70-726(-)